MNDAPFHLTFGVELELIARYNRADYQNLLLAAEGKVWPREFSPPLHTRYGILVRMHMIHILNGNGFPTNEYRNSDFSKWTVDTDGTVYPDDTSEDWYAIELITPVFDSPAGLKQVETVVQLLVSKFRLHVNESCGLHVHVGNEHRGFTLRTLKNFCSLITAFEDQLDSLHPLHRLQNENAKSTRSLFYPGAPLPEKLSIIEQLKTVDDLIHHFHLTGDGEKSKSMAFNFFNLQESLPKPLRTIEFRQHQGTLDPKLIINWVVLAFSLVKRSYDAKAGFRNLIAKRIYNTKYTVIDLFKDLELSIPANFYGPRLFPRDETRQNPAEDMEDRPSTYQYNTRRQQNRRFK